MAPVDRAPSVTEEFVNVPVIPPVALISVNGDPLVFVNPEGFNPASVAPLIVRLPESVIGAVEGFARLLKFAVKVLPLVEPSVKLVADRTLLLGEKIFTWRFAPSATAIEPTVDVAPE
jgi:hypothetical protein